MSDGVDKLKQLLFDREAETIGDLARRIELVAEAERLSHSELKSRLDELRSRAVMGDELSPRVAAVLDEVIRTAEEHRHDEVASAMAPLVVRTIKTELRNSQDEMVEVLYPHVGRMVKSYVATAINELMDKINRRLKQNALMLRFRSVISGRSVAELALVDEERLRCEELYLIRRGTGALVSRWPERPQAANSDAHMSGVLAAINEFAAHNFKDDGGNVRAFALDDFIVFMRASPLYLLAAKCRGTPVPGLDDTIDREFLSVTEAIATRQRPASVGAAVAEEVPRQQLATLAERIDLRVGEAHMELARAGLPFNPLKALATLIFIPLAAWLGWLAYTHWFEVSPTQRIAQTAIDESAELKGYPLRLEVGPRGQTVTIEGLVPSQAVRSALVERLGKDLPDVAVRDRMTMLPSAPPDPEPRIAEVRRQLTMLEADLVRNAVRRSIDRAQRRLENSLPDLAQLGTSPIDSRRQKATEAARGVEQAIRELGTLRTQALADSSDQAAVAALNEPLRNLSISLATVAASLSSLLSGEPPRPAAISSPAAGSVPETGEELALLAERVANVAAATAQTSALRIPEPPRPPTPRQELEVFTRSNAVFFGNGEDYRADAEASEVLSRLVTLLQRTQESLRVVGYTDERGGTQRNTPLAQARADRVAADLVTRGIPRERLIAVGRANGPDLSPTIGPESPNRRVEFEIAFPGESAGAR